MADETIIVNVEYTTGEAKKNIDSLTNSIVDNEVANSSLLQKNKEINKQLKKNDEELKKEGKSREGLTNEIKANTKTIEKNKDQISKEKKERKDNQKLISAEAGSRNKLRLTIAKLRKERNALNTTTIEGAKRSEELRDKINSLDSKLKDSGTEFEKNKMSIGGYKDAIKDAFGELGLMGNVLDTNISFQEKFNNLVKLSGRSFKAASTGIGGSSKALKIFKVALISTGIGAIVVGLGLLIAAFTKTTSGANKISKVLSQIGAVIDSVVGRFAKLGGALVKVFKGDLQGAALATKEAFSGLNEEIQETIKETGRLADLAVQFTLEEREIRKTIATLEARRALERDIAEDDTRGFKERAGFYAKEAKTIIEIAEVKRKLAENNLTLIEGEVNQLKKKGLLIANDQLDALADAQIALEAAENEKLLTLRDSEELRRKGVRDLFEYELDFLIDTQEKQKQINAEKIKDTNIEVSERLSLLQETARLSEESFRRQAAAVEEFTGKKVDFDSLARESDAKTIFSRLQLLDLDDITLNRSREIIQERKLLLNDFANFEKLLTEERKADLQSLTETQKLFTDNSLQAQVEAGNAEINQLRESTAIKADVVAQGQMEEMEAEAAHQAKKQENLQVALGAAQELASAFFSYQSASRDADYRKEIKMAGDNEEKKAAIEKKYAKKKQKAAIQQALINGALAITMILAQVPKFDFGIATGILVGTTMATTALQVAAIRKQQFALGGQVPIAKNGASFGTFKGASHAGGGIDLYTGSGQHVANVEGNENFYVLKKNASDYINSLSGLNQSFGGVALSRKSGTMAEGGQAEIPQATQEDVQNMTQDVINNFPPIIVQVQDIKTGITDSDEVVEAGIF